MVRTTIWYDPDRDRQALRAVRERWGLDTDSAAWRFALRVVAQAERLEVVLPEEQEVKDDKR